MAEMKSATIDHEPFGRLGEPSLPFSQAEDSMQASGSEKPNARQPRSVSAEPGIPDGLFIA
jgi:hypothetical protein